MSFKLEASITFKNKLKNFGKQEKKKVTTFINTFQNGGFLAIDNFKIQSFKVRNKRSDDVPTEDPLFVQKVKFALENKLWHFHAGFYSLSNNDIEGYTLSSKGDLTSQWVIHYQKFSDVYIKAVDITPHPPLDLPTEESFK